MISSEQPLGLIGRSDAMRRVRDRIIRFASSSVPVLILGETGTGKDLCARAIWSAAGGQGSLVPVNCAAIPESLADTTLFGHARGAFTGAARAHTGLIAQADGGTLFLDEIAELSTHTQARLLRAIDPGEYTRVGGERLLISRFRLIAATHADLDSLVQDGKFREDLLHRLGAVRIVMPPLRRRASDVPELAEFFLREFRRKNGFDRPRGFTADAARCLKSYYWRGNVRQLKNVVEAAGTVAYESLRIERSHVIGFMDHAGQPEAQDRVPTMEDGMNRAQDELLRRALRATDGNRKEAMKLLRISEASFYRKQAELRKRRHGDSQE